MSVARDINSVLPEIKAAMDRERMLDAWELAQATGLPLEEWPQGEARRQAARLVSNLGNDRLCRTLDWLNWRADRKHPRWFFHALFTRGTRTPGLVLNEQIERRLKVEMPDSDRADLLAYQAWIHAGMRDFDPAYELIHRALAIDPEDSWLHVQYSSILEAHDRYEEALEESLKALTLRPDYRAAVLQSTDVLIHLGRDDDALEFLASAHSRTQQAAFPFRMQAIYSEREDHVNGLRCLAEAEALYPLTPEPMKKWLAGRRADFLYMAGDIDGCLECCDRKGEGFQKLVAENLRKPGARDKLRKRLHVPFVRQHRMTCGPATLAAIASYWGKPHNHLEIAAAICHEGTPWHKEHSWAESQGFIAREFRLTPAILRELIDRGVPFTLTTQWTTGAHLQACTGYDERTGMLLARDPTERHFTEMFLDNLLENHPVDGPRCMVVLPPEEASRLEGVILPGEAAYEAHHQLLQALDGHDRWKVDAALATLRSVAPGSMLALQGEARVAAYLRDPVRELAATEALLARAPAHGHLLLRKSYLLEQLGRRAERREHLERCAADPKLDPVFISELGELLMQDARELPLAEHHLKRALRKRMTHARCYESLARCRDRQHRYEESAPLHRAAATLAPDFEGYARAYFDTCRILRRAEQGLEFLRSRTRQHGLKDPGPWITLASSIDLLRNDREALAVLEEARRALPENGELLMEAGSMMAGWGGELRERGQQWVESARGKVPEGDWLRSSARMAGFLGDRKLAILRARTLLKTEPLAIDAWRMLVRLVAEEEGEKAAMTLVDEAVRQHPHQTGLWALQAEWNRSSPAKALEALDRMIELDRHDRWAWRERALRREEVGRKEEAIADAREALALDPCDAMSHGILGVVLRACGQRDEARREFQEALKLDIDYVFAARRLLELAQDRNASLEAIRFIKDQMRQQVSTGDIVPAYQELAWRFIEPPELLAQLKGFCLERPDLWQTWQARLRQALQMRDAGEALSTAQTLTANFPLLPRAWMELAEVHRAMGRMIEEEKAVATALDLSPGWDEAARQHADVLERMGRVPEAEAIMRRALSLEPLNAANYGVLADFLRRTGRRAEALQLLRKSVEIAPYYDWGWEARARWGREDGDVAAVVADLEAATAREGHRRRWWSQAANVRSILRQEEECLAAIRRGLEIAPEDRDLRDQYAHQLCNMDRHDEAVAACVAVAGEDRTPTSLEGRRAWILMQAGQPVKAIETMQALLAREPDYEWGMSQLAEWLSRRGDWDKLRDLALKWTRLSPGESRTWGYLGQAERALKNVEAAKQAYLHGYQMQPDYFFAGRQLADIQMELREFDAAAATIRMLRHYAPSPHITCDAIELALKRSDQAAALQELGALFRDPEVDAEAFHWCAGLFQKAGQETALNEWLTEQIGRGGPDTPPGALVALLATLPAKRRLKDALTWILREAQGSPARADAWQWALDQAGREGRADLLRKWTAEHRRELQADGRLWRSAGGAMADANMPNEGVAWLSGWQQRPDDVTAPMLADLAGMCDRATGPGDALKMAADVRRHALARFPADRVASALRGLLAFHCATVGQLDEARALLAEFEPGMVNEHCRQLVCFAEAIIASAEGRNEDAANKARSALLYLTGYANDPPTQNARARGELALVSHQKWAKGRIGLLRKKWNLPKPDGSSGGLEMGEWGKIGIGTVLVVLYVLLKACT